MTDPLGAVESAVFAALDSAIVGATVYQDAPADVPLPVVIIGDMDGASGFGGKGDNDLSVPLTIVTLTDGDERQPCTVLLGQIRTILHEADLSADGFSIRPIVERSSAALSEDGAGYIGLTQLTVFAFAN